MIDATTHRGQGAGGPAAAPAGGGLENTTDNSSPHPDSCGSEARLARWIKLDWLRVNSRLKRQRFCMLRAYLDIVGVRQGFERIGYAGVMACGSRICPVCGPRIAHRTKDDLEQAIRAWR